MGMTRGISLAILATITSGCSATRGSGNATPAPVASATAPIASAAAIKTAIHDGHLDEAAALARKARAIDPTDGAAGLWLFALTEGTPEGATLRAFAPPDSLPPVPAAATPGIGAWIAAPSIGVHAAADRASKEIGRYFAGTRVDVLEVSGSWARVRGVPISARRSFDVDVFHDMVATSAGATAVATVDLAPPAAPIEGWIPAGFLASSEKNATGSTAELVLALDPTREHLVAALEEALAADDARKAVALARAIGAPGERVKATLYAGCRGDRARARSYALASPDGPPPDACAPPLVTPEPACGGKSHSKEKAAFDRGMARLAKSFPGPAWWHLRLTNPLPIAVRAETILQATEQRPHACDDASPFGAQRVVRMVPILEAKSSTDVWVPLASIHGTRFVASAPLPPEELHPLSTDDGTAGPLDPAACCP